MRSDRNRDTGVGDQAPNPGHDLAETVVPADFFDELLDDLDEPDPAPNLARAAERLRRTRIDPQDQRR